MILDPLIFRSVAADRAKGFRAEHGRWMEQTRSPVQQVVYDFGVARGQPATTKRIAIDVDLEYRTANRNALRRSSHVRKLLLYAGRQRNIIAVHATDQWPARQCAAMIERADNARVGLMNDSNTSILLGELSKQLMAAIGTAIVDANHLPVAQRLVDDAGYSIREILPSVVNWHHH